MKRISPIDSDIINITTDKPTICIIGAGLGGLLTAINIANATREINIIILDKPGTQSNTKIAGMRIRQRAAGIGTQDPDQQVDEVTSLLAKPNEGNETPRMRLFAHTLIEELNNLSLRLTNIDPNLVEDEPNWFGPRLGIPTAGGKGRGKSIKLILEKEASDAGVLFLTGEAISLNREGKLITGFELLNRDKQYTLRPDITILANGSGAGALFRSTMVPIDNSATELAFNAGIPLEGGTEIMLHPFGRIKQNGEYALGCYETDELAHSRVILSDGSEDTETTHLLSEHLAHNQFDNIAKRFLQNGREVKLVDRETGEENRAGVAIHSIQLGTKTEDGTSAYGISNLQVVGDAGGLSYWTEGHKRPPGLGLANCIVGARLISNIIQSQLEGDQWNILERRKRLTESNRSYTHQQTSSDLKNHLRDTNTLHVLNLIIEDRLQSRQTLQSWRESLKLLPTDDDLVKISNGLTYCWERRLVGNEKEPIDFTIEGVKTHTEKLGTAFDETFAYSRFRRV